MGETEEAQHRISTVMPLFHHTGIRIPLGRRWQLGSPQAPWFCLRPTEQPDYPKGSPKLRTESGVEDEEGTEPRGPRDGQPSVTKMAPRIAGTTCIVQGDLLKTRGLRH